MYTRSPNVSGTSEDCQELYERSRVVRYRPSARELRRTSLASIVIVALASANASAQWSVTDLHPLSSTDSIGYGVGGGQQAGWTFMSEISGPRAAVWSGTSGSWVNLHPPGPTLYFSQALAALNGKQVGAVSFNPSPGGYHASLWSGSPGSWIDLHPVGSQQSVAWALAGEVQVGQVEISGRIHAAMWRGTRDWVDLTPAGDVPLSYAYSIADGQQGGQALIDGVFHAGFWRNTAASWIDLNPSMGQYSIVWGVGSGQQAGGFNIGGGLRAAVWSGSAASIVDLSPIGSTAESLAYSTSAGYQVGYVRVGGANLPHASLWNGSPSSWVDLHGLLPPGYDQSTAYSVTSDGTTLSITGFASGPVTADRNHAILWTKSACFPPSITHQPDPVGICPQTTAEFTAGAAGTSPLTYQWQWQQTGSPGGWTNLVEGTNTDSGGVPRFLATGVTEATIEVVRVNDAQGELDVIQAMRCRIVNACGENMSEAATISVRSCPYGLCVADYDASGGTPDASDIDAFFSDWLGGTECADADCSGGTPDASDIDVFFALWLAGGC